MSSDAAAPVPQSVAAPVAAPQESESTAPPFGASLISRKDQESASADILPPQHQISEADAAAVADAAAAAAAADAVIAPELAAEGADERPMETDQ
ncbi:emp24/gp25L/p24 family of membrane trafficking proteins [Moesziomyces antarcticus T-34]|uniref:Emp24/gp25L/p24 family of membrane trafficking proteins n=1 Tax=Pseudozyma antarctica (strain T-34) TaxID=1151754 RepID=M9M7W1_PSEA3|nr:emp24/gp25L/p24 family of membrane trafficking proteins [Moesziomyces antarcticus T-34]